MKVQIVSFHCVVKNKLGQFISSSFNHDVMTTRHPSEKKQAEPLSGFVEGLHGVRKGQKKKICVDADRAYGFYNPALAVEVPRSKLPKGKTLKTGDEFLAVFEEDDEPRLYRVTAGMAHSVMVDGNHPLAGQDLVFDIEVTASRMENEEEEPEFNQKNNRGMLC
jgi:FKBP-type peptidyl-prolyl cis-trans isomerase SlyD